VIAEFKAGLERMPPSKYKTKQLEIFEAVCGVAEIVVFGRNEASQYAVLYEQIKQAGRKMSEFDLAIAAHAVIKQATILTLDMNAKFDMLPGINVREL
jgi:predicted nucleic acid-binding protein